MSLRSKQLVYLTNTSGQNCSRLKLLSWVNTFMVGDLPKILKIQELCSGVVYCIIMSSIEPRCINLKKLKMQAKTPVEYIHNLRMLQNAFTKLNFQKDVPIEILIKGKMQDNLEFLQWFKKFYDSQVGKSSEESPKKVDQGNSEEKLTGSAKTQNIKGIKLSHNDSTNIRSGSADPPQRTASNSKQQLPCFEESSNPRSDTPTDLEDSDLEYDPSKIALLKEKVRQLKEEKDRMKAKCHVIYQLAYSFFEKLHKICEILKASIQAGEHVEWCKAVLASVELRQEPFIEAQRQQANSPIISPENLPQDDDFNSFVNGQLPKSSERNL